MSRITIKNWDQVEPLAAVIAAAEGRKIGEDAEFLIDQACLPGDVLPKRMKIIRRYAVRYKNDDGIIGENARAIMDGYEAEEIERFNDRMSRGDR